MDIAQKEQNPAKKILVVEDDNAIGKILNNKLNEEGFVTLLATTGTQGLALALQERPDLILLDLVLPEMDGITMLKELRKDPWGKSARVLIMTNLTSDDKLQEAFSSGVYEYLIKSNWDLGQVIEKIKHMLSS